MNLTSREIRYLTLSLFVLLAVCSASAYAEVSNVGVLNNAHDKFKKAAEGWQTIILMHATWLFWLLATISMAWTFGSMALRQADIGEFFAEFIRFSIFTGFFWWLLQNGPQFALDIMLSLRQIGAQASGLSGDLTPSGIVDVGFNLFYRVVDQTTFWEPMDSLFGLLLAAAIMIVFALVGANMLLLLVSGYFLAYAGVFILGFGGSKWTSDMAIGYYKSILNIGLQLLTMSLIIGIGRTFVDEYYLAMSVKMGLKEMGVMAVVAAGLLFLVGNLPPRIGALAGGPAGDMGSNFGVGAAVAAAAMGAAAISGIGSAIAAGVAGTAGGAQALKAAFSKATAEESGSHEGGAGESGAGNNESSVGGGAGSGDDASTSGGGSGGDSSLSTAMGDNDNGSQDSQSAGSPDSTEASGESKQSGVSPGTSNQSKAMGKARSATAKAGKVAMGTVANLAQGSWDVFKQSASNRVANTTGGKIASAIRASEKTKGLPVFENNSLAGGAKSADAASEIAAFRDGSSNVS